MKALLAEYDSCKEDVAAVSPTLLNFVNGSRNYKHHLGSSIVSLLMLCIALTTDPIEKKGVIVDAEVIFSRMTSRLQTETALVNKKNHNNIIIILFF